jgi:hypothetical protein
MTVDDEFLPASVGPDRAWRFDLVLPLFLRPRATLERIAAFNHSLWRTPVLLLVLGAVGRTLAAGWVQGAAAGGGEVDLPPGFEYYTPEQMAQFQQAATATNNPTFNYILPALGALLGVIASWLVISWLLHLLLTLLGGRGTSQATINVVAWAGLPLLLRYGVQIAVLLVTRSAVTAAGLSGFAPPGEGSGAALLEALLAQVDIYLLWQIVLLVIAARLVSQLTAAKCWLAVLVVMALLMLLRALPAVVLAQFGDLTVIQPFF